MAQMATRSRGSVVARGVSFGGRSTPSVVASVATCVLAVLATLWFLRAARTLLIPIALAVLASYALEPAVAWLERRRVPRALGSAAAILLLLAGLCAGAYALRDDALELVEALPRAAEHARELLSAQLGSSASVLSRTTEALGQGAAGSGNTASSGEAGGAFVRQAAGLVLAFAGHFVVIVFLVFFLLVSKDHVKRRVVEVMGPDAEQRRTTAAIIDDINLQIQQYLLVLLFTSVVVGVSTWVVLTGIGARHAAMWGLLAGLFNSIPYFGPVVVSGGLFVVGLAQGGGVSPALQMSGASIVITSLEGWLLTPALMGKVERMSTLAVFLGLLLWTWVWVAWGAVLAVPMLVIVKSVADHVQRLRPLGRLLAP